MSNLVVNYLKIATLNLSLGLKFKKDLIKDLLQKNDIDILLMQETEIEFGYDLKLLNIPGYRIGVEINEKKSGVATYQKNSIKYFRRFEMEGENNHLQIFDIVNNKSRKKRIIKVSV